MASIGDLLGGAGDAGKQLFLWGVLVGLVNQVTQPYQRDLGFLVNDIDPNIPLSPADLATAVNRGFMHPDDAAATAKKQGLNNEVFATLTDLAGLAPSPQELAEALRRGIIDEHASRDGLPSFSDGIRQGNLRDVWEPMIKALTVQIPSVAEVMNAWLEGQIEEAEAHRRYIEAGGDPTWFQTSYNANGTAPSPVEAGTMANRGIIPWEGVGPEAVSFHQAFLEGPWRNKWEPAMKRLSEYLPPPRTVTALERAGVITPQQATDLYVKQGLTPELAAAYSADASHARTAADKVLAKGEVEKLYRFRVIDEAEATTMLASLGYNAHDAGFLLAMVDFAREVSAVTSAVSRIQTLYINRKIDAPLATSTLGQLGLPSAQVTELLTTWGLELAANVKILTQAEITDALHWNVIDQATAQSQLEHLGYSAHDAWVLLSNRAHAKLPNEPAQ